MKNGNTFLGTLAPNSDIIGAGGWVTRFDELAADGTLFVGADTNNAYARGPGATRWTLQLRPGDNVNGSLIDVSYEDGLGAYDVAIARSNSAVRTVVSMGYIWTTQDAGASYTRAPIAQRTDVHANGPTRFMGKPLKIDPANPAHQLFATPTGVLRTTDYWANSTLIPASTLPVPTAGQKPCVAFDRSSAVTGGITQGIYIFIPGSGLYRSTNGGTGWAAVAGTPRTTFGNMVVTAAGRVFLCANSNADELGPISIYTGSSWLANPDKHANVIVPSPHTANLVYAFSGGGYSDVSTDNGVTWASNFNGYAAPARQTTNIGWQDKANVLAMSVGNIYFDPIVDRMWMSAGVGVWMHDGAMPTTFQSLTWKEQSLGIENMVALSATFAPNGNGGISVMDRGCFVFSKAQLGKQFQPNHGIDYSINLQHSGIVDYAPEDQSFWVGAVIGDQGGAATGYTSDLGKTWTRKDQLLSSTGGVGGGIVAVLSKDIWLQAVTLNNTGTPTAAQNGLYLTTDRGNTWSRVNIGSNNLQLHPQPWLPAKRLFKDRYTPGRAWIINAIAPDQGIWRIDVNLTTGVPTVTRALSTFPTGMSPGYYTRSKFAQISATEFLYAGGDGDLGIWRSNDSMASWSKMNGTDNLNIGSQFAEVYGIAVGKAAPGSAFQTLWAIGWRMDSPAHQTTADNGKHGLWYSIDNGVTWTRHSQFPGNRMGWVNDLAADPSRFGRVVICFSDLGALMIDYNYTMRLA